MKCEIRQEFDLWFQQNGTHSKKPKITEVNDYMDKRFGKYKARGWVGTSIKPDIPQDENGDDDERDVRNIVDERKNREIDNGISILTIKYDGSNEIKM
jgi:hypothetical protein